MSNADLYYTALQVHNDLARLRQLLYEGVVQRMADAEAGVTASRLEALGGGGAGSHADPTAVLALTRTTDLAADHRRQLGAALEAARAQVSLALVVADLYPPPRLADATDRAALARINGRQEPCCENCAQLVMPDGSRRWEPIDSRLTEATTVGYRLDAAKLLCVWCVERTRAWGRLPSPDELDRHHAGHRVPWPADVERTA